MLIKKEQAPAIWIYEDCFDPSNFIELLEEEAEKEWGYLSWTSSSTGGSNGHVVSDYRTSLEMSVHSLLDPKVNETVKPIADSFVEIFKKIDRTVWDYRECFGLHLGSSDGLQMLKYMNGGEYHNHYDHAPDNSRVLSMVASFSDDYEGGELDFSFFDKSIKLRAGSVILFPSNFPYTHVAQPVLRGTKYSLVTWFK